MIILRDSLSILWKKKMIEMNLNNKNKGIKNHTPTDDGLTFPLF